MGDGVRGVERLRRVVGAPKKLISRLAGDVGTDTQFTETPIFFLVGNPRSGTTWLMRLLNAHQEILCRGEGRFFGRGWRRAGFKKQQIQKQGSSLYNSFAKDEYLVAWLERSVWARDESVEKHLNNLTRLAVYYFMTEKLAKTDKRVVGDKTPLLSAGIVGEVGVVCPEAKVIHIARDGRDVTVSLMHYLWNNARSEGGRQPVSREELDKRDRYRRDPEGFVASGESIFTEKRLRRAAGNWAERVGGAAEDGPSLLGPNYAEVKYEELLSEPETQARRLFEFLGAEAEAPTVRRCVEAASFERRTRGRKPGDEDSTSRAFRKGVAGDWRTVFNERDKATFKEVAGETLIRVGYEKNNDW